MKPSTSDDESTWEPLNAKSTSEIGKPTFQGKPLYHASLAREDYESLLAAHGFRLLDHIVNDPQCGGATVYLARRVAV